MIGKPKSGLSKLREQRTCVNHWIYGHSLTGFLSLTTTTKHETINSGSDLFLAGDLFCLLLQWSDSPKWKGWVQDQEEKEAILLCQQRWVCRSSEIKIFWAVLVILCMWGKGRSYQTDAPHPEGLKPWKPEQKHSKFTKQWESMKF